MEITILYTHNYHHCHILLVRIEFCGQAAKSCPHPRGGGYTWMWIPEGRWHWGSSEKLPSTTLKAQSLPALSNIIKVILLSASVWLQCLFLHLFWTQAGKKDAIYRVPSNQQCLSLRLFNSQLDKLSVARSYRLICKSLSHYAFTPLWGRIAQRILTLTCSQYALHLSSQKLERIDPMPHTDQWSHMTTC